MHSGRYCRKSREEPNTIPSLEERASRRDLPHGHQHSDVKDQETEVRQRWHVCRAWAFPAQTVSAGSVEMNKALDPPQHVPVGRQGIYPSVIQVGSEEGYKRSSERTTEANTSNTPDFIAKS